MIRSLGTAMALVSVIAIAVCGINAFRGFEEGLSQGFDRAQLARYSTRK